MTAQREEFDGPLANYYQRRRQMEASMLEYSQRVRKLNDSRADAYRYNGTMRGRDDYKGSHTYRDPREYESKTSLKYPRTQRPLSFDEKELRSNRENHLSKERPRRDTKSERPPPPVVMVPTSGNSPTSSNLPRLPHYGPSSTTDLEMANRQRQIRINLVNAADLYDLVDLRLQEKQQRSGKDGGGPQVPSSQLHAKVANPEESVKAVEDMRWAKPRRLDPLPGRQGDKSTRAAASTSDQDQNLLIGRSIKNEFTNPRSKTNKVAKDRRKHDDVYVLDKDYEKGRVLYRNQPDTKSNPPDSEKVLDVFLEQAASNFRSNKSLKVRPKRAKRMQLHKPDLTAIPEDSFIRPPGSDSGASRADMLSNSSVPYPTSSSLSAIRDVGLRAKHRDHSDQHHQESPGGSNDRMGTPDYRKRYYSNDVTDTLLYKRSQRKYRSSRDPDSRSPRDKVDLDSVIMTSVYSGLPIDPDVSSHLRLRHVTLDRTSHKERAQKKMKRLIFLRDQPEQNYKREF